MSPSTKPVPLEYRSAGSGRTSLIAQELAAGEALSTAGVCLKLLIGLPMCLIGPFFLTAIAFGFDIRFGTRALPGFFTVFILLCLIVIPLLMWLERRSRGKFLEDSIAGEGGGYSSYGEYELRSTAFLWTLYTEIALLGPRLLWSAIDWWQERYAAASPVRTAAAELAVELFDAGEGRQIADLVRPDRPKSVLYPALKYLIWREWADVSAKRDRVWLGTPTKQKIEALLRKVCQSAAMED